jgi:transporter family protein
LADALYFYAVSQPDTRISILSLLRRSSVVIAFAVGGGIFREKHLLLKGAALAVILGGVAMLSLCK